MNAAEWFSTWDRTDMNINIVIPTYKRADSLAGIKYFKEAQYVLPESQRDLYLKVLPIKRMIVIPDENDGNIARKRNWILNNIERPLLMIDDDVQALSTTEGQYSENGDFLQLKKKIRLTIKQANSLIINGFNLAFEWGCLLWGINVNTDGRSYQQYKPFSLSSVVLGPFMGHLFHDLYYDERMGTKDDYDFSIQILNKHKKILRLNKYAYVCRHGDNTGGIVSQRSKVVEIKYCKAIMAKWGERIISYKIPPQVKGDLLNAKLNIPIGGI